MAKTLPANAPFKGSKIYGPYTKKGGRRSTVSILKGDGSRTTMDYARYQLSVKLGRKLGRREWADHIDNNPQNNDPSNLQVLSPSENRTKDAPAAGLIELICPHCGKVFTRRRNQRAAVKGAKRSFCDKSCSAQFYWLERKGG